MLQDYPEFARPALKAAEDKFKAVLAKSGELLEQKRLQDKADLLECLKLTNRLVSPMYKSPFYGVIVQ
jgi:hypothetical protein